MLEKLKSRKLWAAVAGLVTGLVIVFGVDADTISAVSGAVVSLLSVITYIVTEGKVDAARVSQTVEDVQTAIEAVAEVEDEDSDTDITETIVAAVQAALANTKGK